MKTVARMMALSRVTLAAALSLAAAGCASADSRDEPEAGGAALSRSFVLEAGVRSVACVTSQVDFFNGFGVHVDDSATRSKDSSVRARCALLTTLSEPELAALGLDKLTDEERKGRDVLMLTMNISEHDWDAHRLTLENVDPQNCDTVNGMNVFLTNSGGFSNVGMQMTCKKGSSLRIGTVKIELFQRLTQGQP
jgi:hypothetical protein